MPTDRQIVANRANARSSTGPRTPSGKRRASRNALRHGLAASAWSDPSLSAEIERLAVAIVEGDVNSSRLAQARLVAEAQVDLQRVRAAKVQVINVKLDRPPTIGRDHSGDQPHSNGIAAVDAMSLANAMRQALPELVRIDRYERRALSRRRRAMRALLRGA